MTDRSVSADRFSTEILGFLNELQAGVDEAAVKAVTDGVKEANRVARKKAKDSLKPYPLKRGRYYTGLSYKVDRKNAREVIGEVGNRKYPGLVHLLEKGHATLGGGRTKPYPHMEDGFNEGVKVFESNLNQYIDERISKL